jgi:hypothetical protein
MWVDVFIGILPNDAIQVAVAVNDMPVHWQSSSGKR